ncbi:MAG: hypothetical protein V3576_08995 [Candidatus Cloacimonadota bacterium]
MKNKKQPFSKNTQPLPSSSALISWPDSFQYFPSMPGCMNVPSFSIPYLEITKHPLQLIHNNSQNSPILRLELTGTGIDEGTSLPSNVLLEVQGNDVRLTWNQVISDQSGNPFVPSGYLVFGSDRADAPIDDFLLISYTEQPLFIHRQIARLKDRMFYAVVALDAEARSKFAGLSANSRNASTMSWQEIRALLQLPTGGLQRAE